jgi:hypothetical protein
MAIKVSDGTAVNVQWTLEQDYMFYDSLTYK